MGAVQVQDSDAPFVQSAEEMAGRFYAELATLMPKWSRELSEQPGQLGEVERQVHAQFSRGADLVVAGLLGMVMGQEQFQEQAEQTRQAFERPLRGGRSRKIQLRLFGGLLLWVTTVYCAPRRGSGDGRGEADEEDSGAYVELAELGFGKGCSPALESRVARQAALCPSLAFAQQELARENVNLDVKTVRRITTQCGEGLLGLRAHELDQWRAGRMPAGNELRGECVTVQFDGGRTRIRETLRAREASESVSEEAASEAADPPGRSSKGRRRTCDAQWREPKLVTIFVHDAEGKMKKESLATVDGTFQGPDALAELIAMHLHRLGAARAKRVTFVGDGAAWIWDRVPTIVEQANLRQTEIREVLDVCHAVQHIKQALVVLGFNEAARRPLYAQYRTMLRNGQWQEVVDRLEAFAAGRSEDEAVWTEIAYLRKHGEAGRLKYVRFRGLGVPLGSGAIESSIRRVINQRLKGNGIFWREHTAEAILQVRAQVISGRWDERLATKRAYERRHGRRGWRRDPRPMRWDAESESSEPG